MFERSKPLTPTTSDAFSSWQSTTAGQSPATVAATPRASEPLAIVGIGCRLPGGVEDWPSFWHLLEEGRDAITETPESRWSTAKFFQPGKAAPGKLVSRWGGHVSDIEHFDPQAFGISPREAAMMDPQQRMLLEVAFRAIEDAGTAPSRLAGENVAVYVGISSFDHAVASLSLQDRGVISPYSNTGGSSSIAANRISYCFDLRGPSMAVDTACSSSLIAVHLACEAIRRGECRMALAGGVNALLMPDFTVAFSQLGVLSPDGRCKTFDARANGYVRSEGAGMVLIKPLKDAVAAGDLIHAVIRSTASNQDGRTPGLTVPSGEAQQALIREACRRGGIEPTQIGYVEAHGTGTSVGDPIEANAIGAVVGAGRDAASPCLIGSVKTNIGHLEAAAGITSLIKATLALSHRRIPAHLHFQQANPAIDFAHLGLEVPTTTRDWPLPPAHNGRPARRIAGINGFGYGGANAHVILEEPPVVAVAVVEPASEWVTEPVLVPLAARSRKALAATASSLADWLAAAPDAVPLPDLAATLAHRRSSGDTRGAIVARDVDDLVMQLRGMAEAVPGLTRGTPLQPGELAFAFSGQGPQWWGMGRRLFATSGVFRRVIERCGKEFSRYGSWSLVEELLRDEATSRLKQTRFAQPAIFAIQVGIAAVWKHWGIEPAACVGHSVGEIAAAHVAGALDFEQACRVAFHRGRTMDLATSHGGMLAVGLAREELADWLAESDAEIEIAAVNGPTSLTLSGPAERIAPLAERLTAAGVFCRQLAVEYAFHSRLMDPARDELLASLAGLTPRDTSVPLFSTVTGDLINGATVDAEYWWQNVRQPVLFADAMTCLAANGLRAAVEIGPHPVLSFAINECFQAADAPIVVVPSLHRERDDVETMLGSLGALFTLGLPIDWTRLHSRPQQRLPLPPEPFLRRKLLEESREARESRKAHGLHPLLGERVDSPTPRWEGRLDLRLQTYLEDHRARGACVHPAAGFLEAACAAARQLADDSQAPVRLQRLVLRQACIHDLDAPQWMACRFTPDRRVFDFSHRGVNDSDWTELASVGLATETGTLRPLSDDLEEVARRCDEAFDQQRLYAYCHELGLDYGPTFQGMQHGRRRTGECLARVQLPDAAAGHAADEELHPALLDACFHGMIAADRDFDHTISGLYLPHEIGSLHLLASPGTTATVHVRITDRTDERILADLDIYDLDGQLCVAVRDFASHRVAGSGSLETTADLVYRLDWVAQDPPTQPEPPAARATWLLFADEDGLADQLIHRLALQGDRCIRVQRGEAFVAHPQGSFEVCPDTAADFARLLSAIDREQLAGVVYLWGLDAPATARLTTDQLEASRSLTCRGPLHLVQAWEQHGPEGQLPCFLVTAAAQVLEDDDADVAVSQTPLIGMGRVIASEYGRLKTRLIDLPAAAGEADVAALVNELHRPDHEDEVLLRGLRRWVRRFHPHAELAACPAAARSLPYRLVPSASAGVEDLEHHLLQPQPLADGEVEIEVHAAGLNFSDVMKALDLYPGLPPGRPLLGSECSGVISRVGPQAPWQVGDEVIAVAPGAFGSHVVVSSTLVARKPRNLSHQQAAALPIAFLTALHALHECARIRPGESVLVHAASGGVGLAAMQLIRLAGGRILATAGNDAKRAVVREAGAAAVMDSRSLGFADEARRLTGGVDVILNSLPGEAIPRGIEALAIGGRFLEIGKRDIYADASLGMYAFRNNIAFFGIDLDQLFKQRPERMGELLRTLPDRFESGELSPLPVTIHPAEQAASAFREMQQARHIGKIVIDYTQRPEELAPADTGTVAFDHEASYWIAGGLGGFGIEVAKWLASRGAGTLILGGRSTTVSEQVAAEIAALEAAGTRVRLLPVDITDLAAVRHALATIATEERPLKGIFHTAMVLEDRLLLDLDHATLDRVLRPKLLGGWNLHEASLGLDLDHFVLFSSLSSVFGHAGQANYAAANAALDGLAHHRRTAGLPATVLNWGHLGEVGYLAKRDELAARLERQGVLSFTVSQAMACLGYALASRETQLSVLRMDWTRWRGLGITDRVPPKFAHLLRSTAGEQASGAVASTSPESLREASSHDRQQTVEAILRTKTASLLGIERESLELDRPLLELGLDSLMAVELRNWIESQTAVSLPMSAVMRSGGVSDICGRICARLGGDTDTDTPDATAQSRHGLREEQPAAAEGPRSFAMSAGQQGLWAAFRRHPRGAAYNVFLPTRVRSQLNLDALQQTMDLVVSRHETLRTTFAESGGELLQHVHASLPPEFTVVDAADMTLEAIRERATADAQRPFDLEQGPLLRVNVYRRSEDDWIVQATSHHIATDFWSLILLLGEISAGYAQLTSGSPVDLPQATNNYGEFVARQQRLLTGEQATHHAAFWRAQLEGMPTVLDLPTDRPRPAHFSGRAASESVVIDSATSTAVVQLASQEGVTPSAVMLTAVELLLGRLTNQSQFLIGMPFAGRSQRRFEDTVGFFVNMLPIPARLDSTTSFRGLVRQTGQTLVAALEHEEYPLAQIVADAGCRFDAGRSPLFQVSCTFEKSHRRTESGRAGFLLPDRAEAVEFAGLRQETFHVPHQACVHDLEFVFEQTPDGFRGMLHFASDLFAPATIACLARNLEALVSAAVAAPDTPATSVAWPTPPLPPANDATATGTTGDADRGTVPHLLAPVLQTRSTAPAIHSAGRQRSYHDLAALAWSLQEQLAAAGVAPGSLVPVVGEGGEGITATLTTLLAGYAPIPIDATQPAVTLQDLKADAELAAIVQAGDRSHALAASASLPVIDFDRLERAHPPQGSLPHTTADTLAYGIFTSGSTGRPKGVLVEHRAVANLLSWRQQAIPVTAEDRMLLPFSHQFDAGLGMALACLAGGATLVVAESGAAHDPDRLIEQIIAEQITILPTIPSLLQLLTRHPRFAECTSLRQIWCGGEALPADLPPRLAILPDVTLWNLYGPTETTVEVAACQVPTASTDRARIPIGLPAAAAMLAVVDEHLQPLPDGLPGELVIAGPGLARGYLGRPELTAERFPTLPTSHGGVRVYRTGDRCRRLADGRYELLGRLDDQVKLRGYRVELGEIEACLADHPHVAEAAVACVAAGTPEARLAAFVVPTDGHAPTPPEDLRRYLASRLPRYKHPATIQHVDTLPRTTSGKLDRSRLPDPVATEADNQPTVSARTPLEAHLVAAWEAALGLETVGVTDSFFDLGGTSLQAAMQAAQLREDLGVDVPAMLFFELTEIGRIARRLVELHPAAIATRFGESALAAPDDAGEQGHPLLVPLRTDGEQTPLFMIHPPGGIVVCYAALARELAPGRPVMGIRSRGLHGGEPLPESLSSMAAEYVQAIQHAQPAGPYLIGGWSLGGVIASEVARLLLAEGHTVERLVLIDSALPDGGSDHESRAGGEYGLDLSLAELGSLPPEQQLPFLYDHARKLGLIDETAPEPLVQQVLHELQRLFAHHARLCSEHVVEPMPVDAVLLRPAEVPFRTSEPADRGWGEVLKSVEVRQVPGHHHSMVTATHAHALAAAIDDALEAAAVS